MVRSPLDGHINLSHVAHLLSIWCVLTRFPTIGNLGSGVHCLKIVRLYIHVFSVQCSASDVSLLLLLCPLLFLLGTLVLPLLHLSYLSCSSEDLLILFCPAPTLRTLGRYWEALKRHTLVPLLSFLALVNYPKNGFSIHNFMQYLISNQSMK